MEERVACAECGARYDSRHNAFCPRCGSVEQGKPIPGALEAAGRIDPARRRVQACGIGLALVGILGVVLLGIPFLNPPEPDAAAISALGEAELFSGLAGGTVTIQIQDGEMAVAGAPIQYFWLNGTAMGDAATNETGIAVIALEGAFANITIAGQTNAGNATWTWITYVPEGTTSTINLDTSKLPADQTYSSTAQFTGPIRGILGFMILFSAIVAAGGIAAVRLKGYPVALSAAIITAGTWAIFAFMVPTGATLLTALMFGLVLFIVVRGKRFFGRSPLEPHKPKE